MRTIKRYANRKLYDTEAKQYVTLDGIAGLVRQGEDIQVVDNETGEDLTAVTLSQIILEREKAGRGQLPKSILTSLVRTGGGTLDLVRRSLYAYVGTLRLIEEQMEEWIDALVERGEIAAEEGEELREQLRVEATASARDDAARDRLGRSEKSRGLEDVLHRIGIPTHQDVERIARQLERLSDRVDALLEAERRGDTAE
jgi:polyhydroxyalkanoate synthesis repressor PhaR